MPTSQSLAKDDSCSIRPILPIAFQKLDKLEGFTSAQDALYLDMLVAEGYKSLQEPPLWSSWPTLKHLALCNLDISSHGFLRGLESLHNLEILVLTCAYGEQNWATSRLLTIKPLKVG